MATSLLPPLDLYSIALLLNYERATTEPRFRHVKLCDIATASSGFANETIQDVVPEWMSHTAPKAGFIFEKELPEFSMAPDEPDLPSNMLASPIPANLRNLTAKELETIFWQARGHNGCYKSVSLLQHFFDLYPLDAPRVRTSAGTDHLTSVSSRVILEMELVKPTLLTVAHVKNGGTYMTGWGDTMMHVVMAFAKDGKIATVLDLASMQFGDAGRGLGGRSTFALESMEDFYDRADIIARGAVIANTKMCARIDPSPDDVWLKQIAKRVKARWEQRDQKAWCGHCGAPGDALQRCSLCHKDSYCDAAHQTAAWPFHKRFCAGKKR
ncbi:hypothetical protein DFH09DRAFT_1183063 [Mycena vulgaris]|nr:hypothetical protein DFH09DRAFT_1183063 [Mycena vulgaris]